jgi:hypothetical protein
MGEGEEEEAQARQVGQSMSRGPEPQTLITGPHAQFSRHKGSGWGLCAVLGQSAAAVPGKALIAGDSVQTAGKNGVCRCEPLGPTQAVFTRLS